MSLKDLRWPAAFPAASAKTLATSHEPGSSHASDLIKPENAYSYQTALDLTMVSLCQRAADASPTSPDFLQLSADCKNLMAKLAHVTTRFKYACRSCDSLLEPWLQVQKLASEEASLQESTRAVQKFLDRTASTKVASASELQECLHFLKMASSHAIPGSEALQDRWDHWATPLVEGICSASSTLAKIAQENIPGDGEAIGQGLAAERTEGNDAAEGQEPATKRRRAPEEEDMQLQDSPDSQG